MVDIEPSLYRLDKNLPAETSRAYRAPNDNEISLEEITYVFQLLVGFLSGFLSTMPKWTTPFVRFFVFEFGAAVMLLDSNSSQPAKKSPHSPSLSGKKDSLSMKVSLRRAIFAAVFAAAAMIALRPSRDVGVRSEKEQTTTPVLLVHGMFSTGKDLADLQRYLATRGFAPVVAMDLSANDGTVGIADLSTEVAAAAERLRNETGRSRIDIVGYSMGAMVSRHYIQRRGGKDKVRRFISIAGPHHGVVAGLLSDRPGARDMRPESPVVQDLESDQHPFDPVEVFDFWFPLDAIIVPSISAILRGARLSCPFIVKSHGDMIHDGRTQAAVAEVLRTGTLEAKDGCTEGQW